jgi:Fe-S oxidoreductase
MEPAIQPIQPKSLPDEALDKLSGLNLNYCLTCGTCAAGCPISGTPHFPGQDVRKTLRMLALGMLDEVVASDFPWLCTGCGRCAAACPMDLDIPAIMGYMKHLRPRDKVPGVLHKGVENVLNTGNNMAIPKDDYLYTLADMGVEQEEEWPGFYVPVDRQGASVLFFPNSKEVYGDFEDMLWWWKIFYAAREKWSVPSENWEAVDWALFTGDYDGTHELAQRKINHMNKFDMKRMIMPDCGGGSYGCRMGLKMCELEDPNNVTNFVYLYDYLKEIIQTGRIKLDKSVHAGKTFTWHDSCKHGRELEKHYGKGYYEEPRWILNQCVDSFVDMEPNRVGSFCCGAGGGNWPLPYEDHAAYHGRRKYQSIIDSGADVVVVGCSNCRDQMMRRYPKYFECNYEVKYIWEVVADCLVIEPYTDEEIAKCKEEAAAQWERLGVDLDADMT